jgi:hypothetical protein
MPYPTPVKMLVRSAGNSEILARQTEKNRQDATHPTDFMIIQDVRPYDFSDLLLVILLTDCVGGVKENGAAGL